MKTSHKITIAQWMSLWIFPLMQVLSLLLFFRGIETSSWSCLYLLVSAFFLNFSLHITYHYTVHFPVKSPIVQQLLGVLKSWMMGLPFHYYLMSHWNHHKHNNSILDFTSTWKKQPSGIVPHNVVFYSLFWPFSSSISLPDQIKQGVKEGYCNKKVLKRMVLELITNAVFFAWLGWISWIWLAGYFFMVYVGWVLIALQNFGQHLPQVYGLPKANSFFNKTYNWIFVNNGLHEEHHEVPAKKYWELTPNPQNSLSEIAKPHLIEAFFTDNHSKINVKGS